MHRGGSGTGCSDHPTDRCRFCTAVRTLSTSTWTTGASAWSSLQAVQVPCALHTRLAVLPADGEPRVEGGTLHLGDVPLRIGRVTDPRVPTLVR